MLYLLALIFVQCFPQGAVPTDHGIGSDNRKCIIHLGKRRQITEPRNVTRVFKLISAPWTRARFSDVVGLALRFDALTIPRPGMVNEMEWSEVDLDAERWTIPAAKMKTGWDHVVPL
jgi:integrase